MKIRLRGIKMHQAIDFKGRTGASSEFGRRVTAWFVDEGPGQVNRVKIWWDADMQVAIIVGERSGETRLVTHGNIEYMIPMDKKEEQRFDKLEDGKAHSAGQSKVA